jgi:AcrR family transcriptional regulator
MPRGRVSPQDWSRVALEAIAEGGLKAVAVEALAPRVGASKGSFYWHFADRAALVEAAVLEWERMRTTEVISELREIADPRERLKQLFLGAFAEPQAGYIEAALTAHTEGAVVSDVLRRVTAKRLAFVAEAFRELGFDPRQASIRSLVAYSTLLGSFTIRQARRTAMPSERKVAAFVQDLLDLLTIRAA